MAVRRSRDALLFEGAVIVASIFLAFAIDRGYENDHDRGEETAILGGLRADLEHRARACLGVTASVNDPVPASSDDLINSGELDLLRSAELRSALARADEDLPTVDPFDELQWEHWLRFELEFLRQHHDLGLAYADDVGAAARLGLDVEPIRYPDAGFGRDVPAFWSRDSRNIVVAGTILFQDALVSGQVAFRGSEEVLRLIDEELDRFGR